MGSNKKNAKTKPVSGNVTGVPKQNVTKSLDLQSVRSKFDGFKDVLAKKIPEGKDKAMIMGKFEDLYFDTAGWSKQITEGQPV